MAQQKFMKTAAELQHLFICRDDLFFVSHMFSEFHLSKIHPDDACGLLRQSIKYSSWIFAQRPKL